MNTYVYAIVVGSPGDVIRMKVFQFESRSNWKRNRAPGLFLSSSQRKINVMNVFVNLGLVIITFLDAITDLINHK